MAVVKQAISPEKRCHRQVCMLHVRSSTLLSVWKVVNLCSCIMLEIFHFENYYVQYHNYQLYSKLEHLLPAPGTFQCRWKVSNPYINPFSGSKSPLSINEQLNEQMPASARFTGSRVMLICRISLAGSYRRHRISPRLPDLPRN